MSNYKTGPLVGLFDPTTNAPVGFIGLDGKEYFTATGAAFGFPGTVTITGGSINNANVGVTSPAIVKTSDQRAVFADSSGTPGNVTNSNPRGRAAFAAAGTSVTVTSSLVTAASTVLVQLGGADATLTAVRVTQAAGSFTVTGNAAATGTTPFDFQVIN